MCSSTHIENRATAIGERTSRVFGSRTAIVGTLYFGVAELA
jgi:hypothetical protein